MIEFIKDTKTELKCGKIKKYGLYKCFCGNEFECLKTLINTKRKKDCGCKKEETYKNAHTKHGLHHTRLYKIRQNMIQRCNNEKVPNYKTYGARGIKVCDEWKNDFMSFYNWSISNSYDDSLSIDRINSDGNYEPNNCRWATKTTQSRNTMILKSNNTSGFRGVCWNKKDKKWKVGITINSKNIYIGQYDNIIDGAKAYNKYVLDNNLEHTINEL